MILEEEKYLESVHGDNYIDYKKSKPIYDNKLNANAEQRLCRLIITKPAKPKPFIHVNVGSIKKILI